MRVLFALTLREGAWIIQIHGPHVAQGKRHVHITTKKLGGKYSWNVDGGRHDEHRFPSSENAIKAAKRLAAKHLGIAEQQLSFLSMLHSAQVIEIHIDSDQPEGRKADVVLIALHPEVVTQVAILGGRAGRVYVVLLDSEGEA